MAERLQEKVMQTRQAQPANDSTAIKPKGRKKTVKLATASDKRSEWFPNFRF